MMRLGFLLIAVLAVAGCSTLHLGFGGSADGVKVVGRTEYCGTPSQASAVHYFPNADAFENWIDYRNVQGLKPRMARNGLLVVEMGERPTGGYHITLQNKGTGIHNGVLDITMNWHAPRLDAAVSQALTSECVAMQLPQGQYDKVKVMDQLGNTRGVVDVSGKTSDSGS